MSNPSPPDIVAEALTRTPVEDRARMLRELLAHTAAGIVVTEGEKAAVEAVYRVGDAITVRRK